MACSRSRTTTESSMTFPSMAGKVPPFAGPRTAAPGASGVAKILPQHDAMTVDRAESELTHAPGFAREPLHDLGPRRHGATVVGVDVVHHQIGEVGMIAERCGRHGVRALPRHDATTVAHEHPPARVAHLPHLEAEHVAVERTGSREV